MVRGALEVVEFVPRQVIVDAARVDCSTKSDDIWSRLRLEHRTLTSCTAALVSIALHAFLLGPVLLSGTPPRPPDREYMGATPMQWVILHESPAAAAVRPASLASPALVAIVLSDMLPTPPLPASGASDTQPADHSSLGVMYGRYVGQIHARIDRAWQRPRTSIGAPIFQCQVQVDQDGVGRVDEITLLQCNGDVRWRLSLVHAIEAASPLPAPPSPKVFGRHVLLEFRAVAYAAGAPAGLYEPRGADVAGTRPEDGGLESQNPFQALREVARASHLSRVIELRIEGSKTEVEPERQ